MKEGECGTSDQEGERVFPPDTKKYAETSCYRLFISKGEQCIMIDIADYHPGMLYIYKSDLEKMVRDLEKGR